MSTNERDTHFLGSAEKLYEKLVQNAASSEKGLPDMEAFKQEQHTIIAQYAYDLVMHTVECCVPGALDVVGDSIVLEKIPDLDAWPT